MKVGLTGGIASGKSTVGRLFTELGVPVHDADEIGRRLMQPGQAGYQATIDHFGQQILDASNQINRAHLREIVFADEIQRAWLENMLHPLIRQHAIELLDRENGSTYAILIVPLMYETGFDQLVEHVIVIDCPAEVQRQRLMGRDGISLELANSMIDAQMTNAERLQHADSILVNASDQDLSSKISALHKRLIELAA
jgi:dephospho-CoA kinase